MSKKHGHHGGAWKLAYADFVTAMMALFLVLWLTSQDEKIKEAVQRSFTNPFASLTKESSGVIPNKDARRISSDKSGNFDSSSAVELAMLRRLSEDLLKALQKEEEPEEQKTTKLDLTPDGLKISIFDRSRRPIFRPQTAEFTPYGNWVMSTLAWQISLYASFTVELEGHTESGHPPIRNDYGDWEISSDRAGAARRKLIEHGVSSGQIRKVAGFGDTIPMANTQPENESNRRITVMLKVRAGEKCERMSQRSTSPSATSLPPESFVPFDPAAPSAGGRLATPAARPSSSAAPSAPAVAGSVALASAPASRAETAPSFVPLETRGHIRHQAHAPAGQPVVTLQRDGERVTAIRIECACGQVIELVCRYEDNPLAP